MNYFDKHIGDYLKDTSHLSLLEHGVYNRLLDVYYTRESAIPDDQAARLIGARSRDEKTALRDVLQEFFELIDGAWIQRRCQAEIARFQDKQAKAKRSAEARWSGSRPQSEGNANASAEHDASDMRSHSEGNAPRARPQTPNPKPQSPVPPSGGAAGTGADGAVTPTAAGEACLAMRQAGLSSCSPTNPKLVALLAAGMTPQELADTVRDYPGKGFAYVLAAAEGRRRDAAVRPLPPPTPAGQKGSTQPYESAYARSERERYERMGLSVAAAAPGSQPAAEFFEMEATDVTPRRLG